MVHRLETALGVVHDHRQLAADALSDWIDALQIRRSVEQPFCCAIPIDHIEPAAAFAAEDVFIVESLKWTAIEAVRFGGTRNPALTE